MKNAKKRNVRTLKRKRKKNPRTQLKILWHRQKEDLRTEELIHIAETTDYLLLMKKNVTEFLKRDDPSFNDFYDMLQNTRRVLEEYETLKNNFWKKYLALCSIDNLAELAEDEEEPAMIELFKKTEDGSVKDSKAKQVLTRQFEKFTDEKIRTELWRRIKKHNPSRKELEYLLNLKSMYSLYKIRSEIEKALREKHKETKKRKVVKDLLYFASQIKTKKGQS